MSNESNKNQCIFVAGHRGMVGTAIVRTLKNHGCSNILTRTHAELDLTNQVLVQRFFETQEIDQVYLAAAKVGGIHANNTYPADFIAINLAIQNNVLTAARLHGVRRLLFLGSSCIYPKLAPQPLKEEYFLTGPLEPTNRPYAVAKISGIEMCWAFNRQYGTQFLAVMPTNLYGPGDNYDLANSHVIPALIRKMHEAKLAGAATATVWGSGKARREFLHSDDMAEACVLLMDLPDDQFKPMLGQDRNDGLPPVVNIGSGEDVTIAELAELIASSVNYTGQIVYDTSRPDGASRKLLDISRMTQMGWRPRVALREGMAATYRDFCLSLSSSASLT